MKVDDRVRHIDGWSGTIVKVIVPLPKDYALGGHAVYAVRKDGISNSYYVTQHDRIK